MSRSVRSVINFIAVASSNLISIGLGFAVTPILLRYLGADRLGAFRLSQDWFGYLVLFEVGVTNALLPLLLQAHARHDSQTLLAVLAAGIRKYLRVAIWTLACGTGLVFWLPQLTRTPTNLHLELWLGGAIGLLFSQVANILTVYKSLADALHKSYLVSALSIVQTITVAIISVSTAIAGWGIIGQFVATAVGGLVPPLGLAILLRRTAPFSRVIQPHTASSDATSRLRSLNRLTLIQAMIGRICLFTDNILVGLFLGPQTVTSFFLTQRLIQLSVGQVQAIGGATWAGLCQLHQSGETDLFRRRLCELTRLTAAFAGMSIVPLAALSKPFVELWVGTSQYAGDSIAILATINAVLLSVFSLWGWVFSGCGRVAVLLPSGIIAAILNLLVSLIATWLFGASGPLIGTALVYLGYTCWKLPLLLCDEFGAALHELAAAFFAPLLPATMVLAALFLLRHSWPQYTWVRLIAELVAAATLNLTVSWYLILTDSEHRLFRGLRDHLKRRFA